MNHCKKDKFQCFAIRVSIPEELVSDGEGGGGLPRSGRPVEQHVRALQEIQRKENRSKSDKYQRSRKPKKRVEREITLAVSRVLVSTRTTSSWDATSFTCFGRLKEKEEGLEVRTTRITK